jgi:hypothetical protein
VERLHEEAPSIHFFLIYYILYIYNIIYLQPKGFCSILPSSRVFTPSPPVMARLYRKPVWCWSLVLVMHAAGVCPGSAGSRVPRHACRPSPPCQPGGAPPIPRRWLGPSVTPAVLGAPRPSGRSPSPVARPLGGIGARDEGATAGLPAPPATDAARGASAQEMHQLRDSARYPLYQSGL